MLEMATSLIVLTVVMILLIEREGQGMEGGEDERRNDAKG